MSTSNITTEVVRRIFDDKEGVYLEVGPDRDAGGYPELRTGDARLCDASEKYFGKVSVVMKPEIARQVAAALIECANELEKQP